jgi:hypothetical protein
MMASEGVTGDDWARRVAELHAAAPVKRKKADPFVKVPLWWAAEAAKATRSPTTLVLVELLHRSCKAKNLTFPFPNGRLGKNGVGREAKRRVLRDLEVAGLIKVDRRHGKTPSVTLVTL